MSRERRQDQRRQRNIERQQQRRAGRPPSSTVLTGGVQFGGIMGWMQRSAKWLFLGGIVIMVVSLGGSTLLSPSRATPTPTPSPTASATPAATASTTATATATPAASATPTPDPAIRRTYSAAPPMTIEAKKKYEAVIHMKKGGQIRLQLMPEEAPNQTNNFVFLAKNRFFDGLTFHRVLPGFVAQGGDPQGTGFGGSGYTLTADRNNVKFDAGVISMASSSAGVSGAQFFITLAPTPTLEATFAAFGRVTQGMDVVRAITLRDPSKPSQPPADVIDRIEIIEGN